MELQVRNIKGEVVATAELSDGLFGVPMNQALVHQALVMYQQNKRQGTHSTKTRSQVSGGGRKPWPQKYTGRARQGSIRAPHWRHGGVTFGPHPRDHRLEMPRKMRHGALKCVLSDKVRRDKLILLDGLMLDSPSTKSMIEILGNLGASTSTLIITGEGHQNVVLSARNLKAVGTLPVSHMNAEQLLKREAIVMTLDAARRAEELWASPSAGGKGRRTISASATPGDELTDEG